MWIKRIGWLLVGFILVYVGRLLTSPEGVPNWILPLNQFGTAMLVGVALILGLLSYWAWWQVEKWAQTREFYWIGGVILALATMAALAYLPSLALQYPTPYHIKQAQLENWYVLYIAVFVCTTFGTWAIRGWWATR